MPFEDDDLQRVVVCDAQLIAQRPRLSLAHTAMHTEGEGQGAFGVRLCL